MACAKTNDLGKLEDEARALGTRYKPRLDNLSSRLDDLMKRDHVIGEGVTGHALASRRLFDTRAELEQLRNAVTTWPGAVDAAAKAGQNDLIKKTDNMSEELRLGMVRVNAEIDALNSWISIAETEPHTATPPAPDVPKVN